MNAGPCSVDGLRAALDADSNARLAWLEWQQQVDSSNSVLLREASRLPDRAALLVDSQHAGRGRRGRVWQSPAGANLYLSVFARLQRPLAGLGGLSLALGIACVEALRAGGVIEAGLKWPNDLTVDGRKLGGLLIELAGEQAGRAAVVAGLGLNLCMPASAADSIDQPWTDLARLGHPHDRSSWAGRLLASLLAAIDEFEGAGFAPFAPRWNAVDALAGRTLTVQAADGHHTGESLGVAADGALRLRTAQGERIFHSAEVTVRAE